MRSVNKVILIGNLTRDPVMKTTTNGQPVATFGIATNRDWVTKKGDRKSLAEYHNVAAWGKLAEICSKFLKKGKLVYLEGYLKTRSWDTENGIRVFKTEIVIYDMIMLDKRPADYVPGEPVEDYGYDEVNEPERTDDEAEEAEEAMAAAKASLDEMTKEGGGRVTQ
jgi:single-strand DNA-binding protein